jgi:uncharacterized integral membrane protein
MAMREAKIVLVVILIIVLINAVRSDFEYHILHTFPFLGGQRPGIYDAAGIGMIIIFLWGLARLNRIRDRKKREKRNQWYRRW